MKTESSGNTEQWSAWHSATTDDKVAMAALRAMVEPLKGKLQGIAARVPFDAIMERVSAPSDVSFEADTVRSIAGWWCRPAGAQSDRVILHLHGGWFNWGSARAFRQLVRAHCSERRANLYDGLSWSRNMCSRRLWLTGVLL